MPDLQRSMASLLLLLAVCSFISTTQARRRYDRRHDIETIPPIAQSGWKVPLEGGKLCKDSTSCINELSAPSVTNTLQYLAIGRGTVTYSCAGRSSRQSPIYIGQNTFLYDAAPLIPKFASEDQFHSYIPRFLEYDYASLDNSTFNCIGNIQRINDLTVFTLYYVDAFTIQVRERINSPRNRQFDLKWTMAQDNDTEWSIYRVETVGGGPPYNCGDQIISDEIPVEYVAEYWFYRREGNVHAA